MRTERVPGHVLRPGPIGADVDAESAFVGFGFRCWMHGLQSGDLSSLEMCWSAFAGALGPKCAKRAVGELSCWVKSLRASAGRPLQILPTQCPGFCQDECLAVSMIAAGQNDVCPAMRACAFALLETSEVDAPVATGLTFAATLRDAGVVLDAEHVMDAVSLVTDKTVLTPHGSPVMH